DQEFLFQRIQVFRHKDELLSGRILTFMILHGQAFFYPSVSTFIIASIYLKVIRKKIEQKISLCAETQRETVYNALILEQDRIRE
ncbi:hypothetical protein, partial [Hominenteromicrobium sp.]|uniref:hypothetical protein n=1 Tax=Hominenteromicrobium sp. TaxID=3073581 RepID=UPI003A9141B8